MNTAHRARRLPALLATGALSVALLAGCSSGGSDTAPSDTATTAGSSDLAQQVADFMKKGDAYPIPTDPVSDPTALQGKTVYYIPITAQAPKFAIVKAGLKDALKVLGASL